jgi:hypothetical protein
MWRTFALVEYRVRIMTTATTYTVSSVPRDNLTMLSFSNLEIWDANHY